MGEMIGLGLTHYPGLLYPDRSMAVFLERTLQSGQVPARLRDPASWPEPMRREWGEDRGATAAVEHRRRHVEALRELRKALDAFAPDFVVIWGDDQYENFTEEIIPPFCVFAAEAIECRPYARRTAFTPADNPWGDAADTVFHLRGHRAGGKYPSSRTCSTPTSASPCSGRDRGAGAPPDADGRCGRQPPRGPRRPPAR
jgi:hypothetical protein